MPPRRPAPHRSAAFANLARVAGIAAALALLSTTSGCASLFESDDGDSGPGALLQGRWLGGCEMQLGGNYEIDLELQGRDDGGVIEASGAQAVVLHGDESEDVEGHWETLGDSQLIHLPLGNAWLELEMGEINDGVAPVACAVSVLDGPDDLPECGAESGATDGAGSEDEGGTGEQDCVSREVVARGDGTLRLDRN